MNMEEREMLLTGTHPDCRDQMVSEDEEDEDFCGECNRLGAPCGLHN